MNKSDIKDMTAKDISKSEEAQTYLTEQTQSLPEDATWAQRKWHVLNPDEDIDFGKMQWTGRGYKELPVEEQVTHSSSKEEVVYAEETEEVAEVVTDSTPSVPSPAFFSEVKEYVSRFAECVYSGTTMTITRNNISAVITSVPMQSALLITEADWAAKPNLCKDLINKSVGVRKGKVNAETLTVRTLPVNVYKAFFSKSCRNIVMPARIAMGIYQDNDLLSAMSFDVVDQTQDSWEIVNYADKIDTNPDGSYKRALNYFKATYFPKKVRVLLDPFKDNIKLWTSLGFQRTNTEYYTWEK